MVIGVNSCSETPDDRREVWTRKNLRKIIFKFKNKDIGKHLSEVNKDSRRTSLDVILECLLLTLDSYLLIEIVEACSKPPIVSKNILLLCPKLNMKIMLLWSCCIYFDFEHMLAFMGSNLRPGVVKSVPWTTFVPDSLDKTWFMWIFATRGTCRIWDVYLPFGFPQLFVLLFFFLKRPSLMVFVMAQ